MVSRYPTAKRKTQSYEPQKMQRGRESAFVHRVFHAFIEPQVQLAHVSIVVIRRNRATFSLPQPLEANATDLDVTEAGLRKEISGSMCFAS